MDEELSEKAKEAIEKIMNRRITKISNGYILIKVGNQWIPEHRLIVEQKIGRMLEKNEVIHHINENKKDNRIENLMVFKSQKEHAKFHVKIKSYGYTNPIKRQIANRWEEFK